ncbi:MAG: right-handed parallel beta-helix repeat-containing protein, partial [Methanosarcina mazei]|nr:right-handed parallel beta-helix repeat-containing protein [Methanosarcina mazei]
GGSFSNVTLTNNLADTYTYGSVYSDAANPSPITFSNVTIGGTFAGTQFVNKDGDTSYSADEIEAIYNAQVLPQETLSGEITSNMTLTSDKVWVLDGLVVVTNGATLTIEPGTTIAGMDGTGDNTSYMIIDKGAKIMAEGTAAEPIIFTSKTAVDGGTPAVGQWGGLTIIGKAGNDQVKAYEVNSAYVADATDMADNSGVLQYVQILNSGITMAQDKEINGLSLVGVGSGTTIDNITVDLSDDDGIEAWGGTVNMSNLTITRCTDDYFDVDDGFSGTVTNLNITTTTGNAAMEMSGTTTPTFDGVTITMNGSAKEGGMYFKGEGIGGSFSNVTLTNNLADTYTYGSVYSDAANPSPITFSNVTIGGTFAGTQFVNKDGNTGYSADEIEAIYNAQ